MVLPTCRALLAIEHIYHIDKIFMIFVKKTIMNKVQTDSYDTSTLNTYTRRYDLDWLRVIAFSLLILYHTGMFFVSWGWHIKNNELALWMELPMSWLNRWRMPLLFLISGMSIQFLLRKRNYGAFALDRLKRLGIPLLFGMFVIVPPQIYFERLTQGATFNYWEFWATVFEFKPYPAGNFSWHHLWYLPYILVYSLVGIPLWRWLRSTAGQRFTTYLAQKAQNPFWLFFPVVLWHWAANFVIDVPTTNDLISDWENHFHSFSLFIMGFVLVTQEGFFQAMNRWRHGALFLAIALGLVMTFAFWTREVKWTFALGALYEFINTSYSWSALVAIFGYANEYLNKPSAVLSYTNRAVYPFYILHQTIIICLAYPMINWAWPAELKFVVLVVGTFGICWALYEGIIKRFGVTRLLFGMTGS